MVIVLRTALLVLVLVGGCVGPEEPTVDDDSTGTSTADGNHTKKNHTEQWILVLYYVDSSEGKASINWTAWNASAPAAIVQAIAEAPDPRSGKTSWSVNLEGPAEADAIKEWYWASWENATGRDKPAEADSGSSEYTQIRHANSLIRWYTPITVAH